VARGLEAGGTFEITRRDFVKFGAVATAGAALLSGSSPEWAVCGPNPSLKDQVVRRVRSVCPYCSIGCGLWLALDADDKVIDTYGDENSITNRGALCSKGRNLLQMVNSSQRIGIPGQTDHYLYGSTAAMTGGAMKRVGNGEWQHIAWDAAFTEIAAGLKKVKDESPDKADSIAFMGSSHLNNEECYLYKKLITLMGTNNVEHCARN
jgi:formate dehydrogenase major subunit